MPLFFDVYPGIINNVSISLQGGPFSSPYDSYEWLAKVLWSPVGGILSYKVTANDPCVGNYVSVSTGTRTADLYFNWISPYNNVTITVTGLLHGCPYTGSAITAPCFLEGAVVQMADGSTKPIETVAVGDTVLGAFGESNEVLALHRPLLGENLMCRINEEHSTTNHHPHISVDKQFYCGNPGLVNTATYGRTHKVIDGTGAVVDRLLHGLRPDRVQPLRTGIQLKTVEGSRTVRVFESYALPPETQLYNLVVGGSHTYHVDGYAVTGWPREDDFNYDTWTPV
jgi:hypothetical protein